MSTKHSFYSAADADTAILLATDLNRDGPQARQVAAHLARRAMTVRCCDVGSRKPDAFHLELAELRAGHQIVLAGGLGIGALPALAAAQAHPESLDGLVLFEPLLVPEALPRPRLAVLLGSFASRARLIAPKPDPGPLPDLAAMAAGVTLRLADITKPTMIVLGEHPSPRTFQAAERLQWAMGGAVELLAGGDIAEAMSVPDLVGAFALQMMPTLPSADGRELGLAAGA